MMTKSEVEEMLKEINASKEAKWQEMAKDIIVDVCEEPDSPDKIERFCESLKEAAVVELAKRKALH